MTKTNAILSIAITAVLLITINNGIKKIERAECEKWQGWQDQHKQFTPSKSMRNQCESYQIILK